MKDGGRYSQFTVLGLNILSSSVYAVCWNFVLIKLSTIEIPTTFEFQNGLYLLPCTVFSQKDYQLEVHVREHTFHCTALAYLSIAAEPMISLSSKTSEFNRYLIISKFVFQNFFYFY